MISQMYLPTKIANTFGRTNNGHTPLAAILFCSALGFLSLVGLSEYAFSQVLHPYRRKIKVNKPTNAISYLSPALLFQSFTQEA
jgi:hypothetical protein